MKKLFFLLSFLLVGQNASASIDSIVNKLVRLDGKAGVASSNFERGGTQRCVIQTDLDEDSVSVTFRETGYYFTPVVHVFFNRAKAISNDTLLVSTSSKRPGGDACGDAGGAVNYKKTLTVTDREVVIKEEFRCAFELFKKYQLISKCSL